MSAICDSCDKLIAATSSDPMVHTSWGREHYRCMVGRTTGRTPPAEATPSRAPLSVSTPETGAPDGQRGSYTCGNCGKAGHNARSCPTGKGALVYDDSEDETHLGRTDVSDPELDAPDGAVVNGRRRVGDQWIPLNPTDVEAQARARIEQRKHERQMK